MSVGWRYSVEDVEPVNVETGQRVTWILAEDGRSWEFITPGALVTCVTYNPNPSQFFFTLLPNGHHGPVTLAVDPNQALSVRFDDGRLPVRLWRWCWCYIVACVSVAWRVTYSGARKVVEFFKSMPDRMGWR